MEIAIFLGGVGERCRDGLIANLELFDRRIGRIFQQRIDGDERRRGSRRKIKPRVGEKKNRSCRWGDENGFGGRKIGKFFRRKNCAPILIREIDDAIRILPQQRANPLLKRFTVAILGAAGAGGEIDHHHDLARIGLKIRQFAGREGQQNEAQQNQNFRRSPHVRPAKHGDG